MVNIVHWMLSCSSVSEILECYSFWPTSLNDSLGLHAEVGAGSVSLKEETVPSSERCGVHGLSRWNLHIGCVPFPLSFLSGACASLAHFCFWKVSALVLLRFWKQERRREALLASCSSSGDPDSAWETRRSWVLPHSAQGLCDSHSL